MSADPAREVDLSDFDALPRPAGGRPVPARNALMHQRFPSSATLNWQKAFRNDPELLGRVLRDILKLDRVVPGRHGPRPGPDPVRDGPALDRLRGLDPGRHPYSLQPFLVAFAHLVGKRSVRAVAAKVGFNASRVYRLLKGGDPTMAEMEAIAAAFGRQPSYFAEYRVRSIHTAIGDELAADPHHSIEVYERLYQRSG